MKNIKSRGILMGAGLLGVGAVLGLSQPVSAQSRRDVREERQEVKEARKDVREERRDVRQADTPRERGQEREELREAKQDLRQEQRELERERQQRAWEQRQGHRSPGYRPAPQYQGRPYAQPRGYYQDRPYYQDRYYGQSQAFRTLEGMIADDLNGDSFTLRTYNGQIVRVHLNNEPNRLDPGDVVRVYGYFNNGVFRAQNFTVLRNR